jgi:hypothetical protein
MAAMGPLSPEASGCAGETLTAKDPGLPKACLKTRGLDIYREMRLRQTSAAHRKRGCEWQREGWNLSARASSTVSLAATPGIATRALTTNTADSSGEHCIALLSITGVCLSRKMSNL